MEKTIAEKIAELRKERKLTQEQLGERLRISGQAVSKWENGAAMPDILLLPELCDILGITIEELLGSAEKARSKNAVADFCTYARETGRIAAIEDAIARLMLFAGSGSRSHGVNTSFGTEELLISDDRGMGFVLGKEFRKTCIDLDCESTAHLLKVFGDRRMLEALKIIAMETVTIEELCEKLNMEQSEAKMLILDLMERNMVGYDTDRNGKRGYLPSANMIAFWMALSACVVTLGGLGNFWFAI